VSAARCVALGIALLSLVASGSVRAEKQVNTCIGCHVDSDEEELSSPVEEWGRSVHATVEVSCDACHGGDPLEEDEELSMSEDDAGFVGMPSWDEVPEMCGNCHEHILEKLAVLETTANRLRDEPTFDDPVLASFCDVLTFLDTARKVHMPRKKARAMFSIKIARINKLR